MATVVGVHGIAQRQLGRNQLLDVWRPSLADGLEAAARRRIGDVPFDLAYFGRLFLEGAAVRADGVKGSSDADPLSLLSQDELTELAEEARRAAGEEALAAVEEQPSKAYTRIPRALRWVFRALDWRFGPGAALLFTGAFVEVRLYLRDPDLKKSVDEVVDETVGEDTRVLIGHSLGSVVAFEFVRRHPDHPLDLLLTLGSPLGARFVRALMPDADHGRPGLPPSVGTWVNVRDPHDPVAFAGDLSRYWDRVRDEKVDNQGDAHAVARYLGKACTGAALLSALPELTG